MRLPAHLLAAAAWLLATPAAAFEVTLDGTGSPVRWPDGRLELAVHAPPAHLGLQGSQALLAAEAAVASWNEALGGAVTLSAVEARGEGAVGYDPAAGAANENAIFFEDGEWPYDARMLAVTIVTVDLRRHAIVDTDIVVRTDRSWGLLADGSDAGARVNDLQNALTHELGHLVGLAHSVAAPEVVMYPASTPGETLKRHLAADDRDGAGFLYLGAIESPGDEPVEAIGCSSAGTSAPSAALVALAFLLLAGVRGRLQRALAAAAVVWAAWMLRELGSDELQHGHIGARHCTPTKCEGSLDLPALHAVAAAATHLVRCNSMLASQRHRSTMLQSARGLGPLLALAGALWVQPACGSEDAAHGSARASDRTTHALTGGELVSVNGSYFGCRNRSGAWSLAIANGAALDNAALSVVLNDDACALTMTSLHTEAGIVAATPTILLTTSYQATPSLFGTPVDFSANAKLSTVLFADDFVLTILYSDDPSLAAGDNTAIAIPPTVVSNTPLDGAVGISIATRPTATFSVTMAPATLTELTFTLRQGATPVSSSVIYDVATHTATLTPDSALGLDLLYEARVTTGAEDSGDTPLAADFVWTFTTAVCSQAPVELGSASSFAVLAASTVTSTGPTTLAGDLGVSPGTAVTGFPPGTFAGTLHSADPAAAAAQVDLGLAYGNAAARTVCPVLLDLEIGGRTLTPGLYWSGSSLAVTSGDLELDALGEVEAVFVFQIGSTLDAGSGRRVILSNGASSSNIYWQVGSSATLGTGSQFAGTIMADQAITLQTGATLDGRALAHGAAVTLDSNTIVEPAQ